MLCFPLCPVHIPFIHIYNHVIMNMLFNIFIILIINENFEIYFAQIV